MPRKNSAAIAVSKKSVKKSTKSQLQQKLGKKAVSVELSSREVLHPEEVAEVCKGVTSITVKKAKELLGWQEEGEDKFGTNFIPELKTTTGKKVRCTNNVTNRPISRTQLEILKQEILRGKWRLNGETIIIGKTGLVLNGQHTLISLILAAETWEQDDYWRQFLDTTPTLEKVIVYGIAEKDDVVNTMDTCKPRSLMEVIFRCGYFPKLTHNGQKIASRMTEFAIKLLWMRTGVSDATRRTHAESLDFLARHPKVLECVKHIYEEDSEGKLGKLVSPGYSAGLMYLMASSGTNNFAYYASESPNEASLDWSNWEKASEYFVELAGGSQSLINLRVEFGNLLRQEDSSGIKVHYAEKWALLIKGWLSFLKHGSAKQKEIALEYTVVDGVRVLTEQPVCGGIDIADGGIPESVEVDTPAKVQQNGRVKKMRAKKEKRVAKKAGEEWAKDDTAWVHPTSGEESFFAKLIDAPYSCDDGSVAVMVSADDGDWEVRLDELQLEQ